MQILIFCRIIVEKLQKKGDPHHQKAVRISLMQHRF